MDKVGIALGLGYSPDEISNINTFQLMVHETKDLSVRWLPEDIRKLRKERKGAKLFCHSVFKVVIGRPYSTVIFRDHYLYICKQKFNGYVVHLPTEMDPQLCIDWIRKMINSSARILAEQRLEPVTVYFEHVPSKYYSTHFAEFAKMLKDAKLVLPVGICVDTCHLYASGISLDTAASVRKYFGKLADVGLPILVHLNDSMGDYESFVDRHAELGSKIWKDEKSGLAEILKLPYTKIIELADCKSSLELLSTIADIN